MNREPLSCIFTGCVATWKHWHGGFPGGYDDPADPEGAPISFTGPEPELPAGWCRDYNGAALRPARLAVLEGREPA